MQSPFPSVGKRDFWRRHATSFATQDENQGLDVHNGKPRVREASSLALSRMLNQAPGSTRTKAARQGGTGQTLAIKDRSSTARNLIDLFGHVKRVLQSGSKNRQILRGEAACRHRPPAHPVQAATTGNGARPTCDPASPGASFRRAFGFPHILVDFGVRRVLSSSPKAIFRSFFRFPGRVLCPGHVGPGSRLSNCWS
jgi:hypothetical protein